MNKNRPITAKPEFKIRTAAMKLLVAFALERKSEPFFAGAYINRSSPSSTPAGDLIDLIDFLHIHHFLIFHDGSVNSTPYGTECLVQRCLTAASLTAGLNGKPSV